jgi:uncharacterized protein YodC (DUF2158 family)
MLAKIPKEASQAQPEKAKTEKAGVNLEEALEKLEANLESWEEKADAMLDSERWHMKPRTEALVTELEEARAKIAEMEGKQAKPAEASAEPEKAQSSEIAGLCSDCGEAVTHRPGKPGEFDHECKAKPADDGPPWIPHDGGPCPLKDEEVEEWEYKMRSGEVKRDMPDERPSYRRWTHENFSTDIIAFRVLRWKPGHGPQAASKADEPARAETFEAVKRERDDLRFVMERQKPWNAKAQEMLDGGRWAGHTYMEGLITELEEARARLAEYAKAESVEPWTPAPGDVVRLKSGGPSMTVGDFTPEGGVICDWFNEGECEARVFPAACLTPAKEDKDDSKVFKPVDDVIWRNP